MTICADVKCYYCGHVSGKITGELGRPFRRENFEPAIPHRNRSLGTGERLRCFRCGGPVFLDDIEQIRRPEERAPRRLARRRQAASTHRKAS